MKESATCALCGHGYAYPADLDVKAGMHCASCGALIYAKTGLPSGSPHFRFSPGPESPAKKTALLPPVKRKNIPAVSERHPDTRRLVEEILKQLPAEKNEQNRSGRILAGVAAVPGLPDSCLHIPFLRE